MNPIAKVTELFKSLDEIQGVEIISITTHDYSIQELYSIAGHYSVDVDEATGHNDLVMWSLIERKNKHGVLIELSIYSKSKTATTKVAA